MRRRSPLREIRDQIDVATTTPPDTESDPLELAKIAVDNYSVDRDEKMLTTILASIPPIKLGKTKYRVVWGNHGMFSLAGPRGGESFLVQSTNDPNAWSHNSGGKSTWYKRKPDHTFEAS